jgi:hypothetical protein
MKYSPGHDIDRPWMRALAISRYVYVPSHVGEPSSSVLKISNGAIIVFPYLGNVISDHKHVAPRNSQVRRGGSTLLTLLGGHREEGRPPLLYVLAFALRANYLILLVLRDCQDFGELVFAGSTEKIVLGHDFLPNLKLLITKS